MKHYGMAPIYRVLPNCMRSANIFIEKQLKQFNEKNWNTEDSSTFEFVTLL